MSNDTSVESGRYIFEFEQQNDQNCLWTENETNAAKLNAANQAKLAKEMKGLKGKAKTPKVVKASSKSSVTLGGTKDAFHEYIVNGKFF